MRSSTLGLILGGLVATMLVMTAISQYSYLDDARSRMRQMVQSTLDQGKDLMAERAKRALDELFEELDTDHDGVIRKSEFKGATLAMTAAMHQVDSRIDLPDFPDITQWTVFGVFKTIVTYQLLFLCLLFLWEHVQVLLFGHRHGFDTKCDYINQKAERVDKDVALYYNTPVTFYERVKMVFFTVTGLVVVRFVFAFFAFALAAISINLSILGKRSRHKNPIWFGFWTQVTNFWGTITLIAMGFYKINVIGKCASSKEAKLLIGNHVCLVELFVMFIHSSMPSFVSRVENLTLPLFRGICEATDAILVDRDAAASRVKTLESILSRTKDPLAAQLMVLPEGTCNSQAALFQFKRGAFEAGQPVQMACFRFPHNHFNCAWSGSDTGGHDFGDLIFRLLCQFVNRVEVVFLPVYTPSEAEKADSIAYAQHVQEMMSNVLRIPCSDATFADYAELARKTRERRKRDLTKTRSTR